MSIEQSCVKMVLMWAELILTYPCFPFLKNKNKL